MSEILHPEWVDGRRIWMDGPMRDLIHRIQFGDPVKGWEGDPRLALYFNGEDDRFELFRLEEDETYRLVCRSGVGIPLDERIIDALIGMDGRRRRGSLMDEIVTTNNRIEAENERRMNEWVAEEMSPRLRHAFNKDL